MACLVYTKVNGEVKCERVCGTQVDRYLQNGYTSTPEQLEIRGSIDTNNSGKLSFAEVKAACKAKGIKVGGKSKAKLEVELGL